MFFSLGNRDIAIWAIYSYAQVKLQRCLRQTQIPPPQHFVSETQRFSCWTSIWINTTTKLGIWFKSLHFALFVHEYCMSWPNATITILRWLLNNEQNIWFSWIGWAEKIPDMYRWLKILMLSWQWDVIRCQDETCISR